MIIDKYPDMAAVPPMRPMTPMPPMGPAGPMEPMAPMPDRACVPQEMVISDVQLAHAYVPFEKMCSTFTPLTGLRNGTIFPPLFAVYGWEKKRMGDI